MIIEMIEAIKRGTDEDATSAVHVGKQFLVKRLSTGYDAILALDNDEERRVLATSKVEDISISSGDIIVYTKNTIYYFAIKGMGR